MFEQMLSHMTFVDVFNWSVLLVFSICYIYQFYYVFVVLTRKPPLPGSQGQSQICRDDFCAQREPSYRRPHSQHSRAELPARAHQHFRDCRQLHRQYRGNRAKRWRNRSVHERLNDEEVGKGYALNYGWHEIQKRDDAESFEAYFVFDADNVLDANYFREMNKVFDGRRRRLPRAIAILRTTEATGFLPAMPHLVLARGKIPEPGAPHAQHELRYFGNGLLHCRHVLKESGGWKWHLLTEDIEFSASSIIEGRRIALSPHRHALRRTTHYFH